LLREESVVQSRLVQPVETESLLRKYGELPSPKPGEVLLAPAWTTALFDRITE
jgi:hypothetical protein